MGTGIRFFVCVIIAWLPVMAQAHPGKTDVRGGHKCWKGCRQWELYHGEYHLHDKEFRPIRIGQPGTAETLEVPEPVVTAPAAPEAPAERPPEPVAATASRPQRRGLPAALPPPQEPLFVLDGRMTALLAAVVMLLCLLLLTVVRRRR